jgi:hypothetical protein
MDAIAKTLSRGRNPGVRKILDAVWRIAAEEFDGCDGSERRSRKRKTKTMA